MNTSRKLKRPASVVFICVCSSAMAFVTLAHSNQAGRDQPVLFSTIAFVSTRHDPTLDTTVDAQRALLGAEIYLIDGDGANPRRLTENHHFDCFPALSPDGSRVVFDSNRLRTAGEPFNTSDLFVMNVDGTEQMPLVRGSSATWSPDGKSIAFHASASGKGKPIVSPRPGSATTDSDIFVLNVDEFLKKGTRPKNITNNPTAVDDDPDWSPDGRKIVFTSHAVTDDPDDHPTAEIYVIDPEGKKKPQRLTNNNEEERAPAWSPDGKHIVFMCRKGPPVEGRVIPSFELCVINGDGSGLKRLTNTGRYLTPHWSPDGRQIVFHRAVGGTGRYQLFLINADGTGEKQLTNSPGMNGFPSWGEVRGRGLPK